MNQQHPAAIVVVGSANMDYIVSVSAAPGPGETVLAQSLLVQSGGKGANQAVAAARLSGDVHFIGAVGDDADGATLVRTLRAEGVDTTHVEIINRVRTGLALVSVSDGAENSITVVPGTNFAVTPDRVARVVERIAGESEGAVVVTQAELLPSVTEAAIVAAAAVGARSIVNLAPYRPLPLAVLAQCDPLVVNETEASSLVGWPVRDVASAKLALAQIADSTSSVVITLGSQGACWSDSSGMGHVPAPLVPDMVDTTGAGDAFVGALAVQLANGESLHHAVEVGVLAGSFSVQRPGAQSSYGSAAELDLVNFNSTSTSS